MSAEGEILIISPLSDTNGLHLRKLLPLLAGITVRFIVKSDDIMPKYYGRKEIYTKKGQGVRKKYTIMSD